VINVPLLYLSAQGDYRINFSLLSQDPQHPLFSTHGEKKLYHSNHWIGRASQKLFLPKRPLRDQTPQEISQQYRRSGTKLQTFAGYGLQAQWTTRLAINLFAMGNTPWNDPTTNSWKHSIIALDTFGLGANLL